MTPLITTSDVHTLQRARSVLDRIGTGGGWVPDGAGGEQAAHGFGRLQERASAASNSVFQVLNVAQTYLDADVGDIHERVPA